MWSMQVRDVQRCWASVHMLCHLHLFLKLSSVEEQKCTCFEFESFYVRYLGYVQMTKHVPFVLRVRSCV